MRETQGVQQRLGQCFNRMRLSRDCLALTVVSLSLSLVRTGFQIVSGGMLGIYRGMSWSEGLLEDSHVP